MAETGKYLPKLEAAVDARMAARRRVLANVAAARADGRWAAATPAERARTRRTAAMQRALLRRAVRNLEQYRARIAPRTYHSDRLGAVTIPED